jgi:hypothetical protein
VPSQLTQEIQPTVIPVNGADESTPIQNADLRDSSP